jgi:origin recognition complex subunit 5
VVINQIPNLTTIFIVTSPGPNFLHYPGVPHIEFPAYTKSELIEIISLVEPTPQLPKGKNGKDAKEITQETWTRFCTTVWESLSKHSGRDILSLRSVCLRLWPRFIRPILDGSLDPIPFSRVLVANRSLFQNENVLVHSLTSNSSTDAPVTDGSQTSKYQGIGAQLPYYSRLILVAAYLASFNPPKTDQLLFMKAAASKRRKKGGGTALTRGRPGVSKNRKISRKLLGPQAFILERMMAIFQAIRGDADATGKYQGKGKAVPVAGAADIQMAIATLASLRLLVRMGPANSADIIDGGVKYRVAIGWDVVRGIARSVGVEAEDYLVD